MKRATNDSEKEQRRALLLVAAQVLFEEQPFEQITMANVARRAGVAKGTLYVYFETKEALFLTLCHEQLAGWLTALDERLTTAPSSPRLCKRWQHSQPCVAC